MTLRNVVPATSIALFVEDERLDMLTVAYSAGTHAAMLRQMTKGHGSGIAGWAAVNRRGVLNADPALDLGPAASALEPPLRSALTVPLAHDGRIVGVLSCYGSSAQAFTEDHMRLLELLAASLAAAVASVVAVDAPVKAVAAAGGRRPASLTLVR
jgi:GAF domain-containing protein